MIRIIFKPLFINSLIHQTINNRLFLLLIYRDKEKKMLKRKNKQVKNNSFFPAKRQKCNQETETQQPEQQLGQSKDVADDVPTMRVQPAAVINYVSCTSKQIKNRRRGYYWCPRKAVKLVGVDVEMLSAADFATYNKKCKFFMWLD
jgi:hypothetical protein